MENSPYQVQLALDHIDFLVNLPQLRDLDSTDVKVIPAVVKLSQHAIDALSSRDKNTDGYIDPDNLSYLTWKDSTSHRIFDMSTAKDHFMDGYTIEIVATTDGDIWQAVEPAEPMTGQQAIDLGLDTAKDVAEFVATNQTVVEGGTGVAGH